MKFEVFRDVVLVLVSEEVITADTVSKDGSLLSREVDAVVKLLVGAVIGALDAKGNSSVSSSRLKPSCCVR